MKMTLTYFVATIAIIGAGWTATPAQAKDARDSVLAHYQAQADQTGGTPTIFSAARGKALFQGQFTTGKPETPSCTSCHMATPTARGRTRAGKEIAPLAVSATPDRFTDLKKTEKWFLRNCTSVLGRQCTPVEKGDFITFMKTK
ncbi:MAG: DUF1924 domain-containing protein [Rhodospirillales bacterium]|nr:DUF1924 domain-containing protein [Rhodospirillales bacterium]